MGGQIEVWLICFEVKHRSQGTAKLTCSHRLPLNIQQTAKYGSYQKKVGHRW